MTWVPSCIAFLAGSLAASEPHQAQNNSQHPNIHTSLTLSGFPFLRVRLRKAPLPSSKSSAKVPPVISMRTLLGCSWLLNILKHYTQHLSLRHLMPVCSWSLHSIHPRLPWWNFIWHREMQVAKTKRFRTAEINSPISERSTDTNCKRSSNRIRYAVGTWLLRFGLWRWTQTVWRTWLSTN